MATMTQPETPKERLVSDVVTGTRAERPSIEHELKTWQSYFHAIADGSKTFEVRRDDRDFRIGDTLWLRETEYGSGKYTGREARRTISHILRHEADLGLADGFAILSLFPERTEGEDEVLGDAGNARAPAVTEPAGLRAALDLAWRLDNFTAHDDDCTWDGTINYVCNCGLNAARQQLHDILGWKSRGSAESVEEGEVERVALGRKALIEDMAACLHNYGEPATAIAIAIADKHLAAALSPPARDTRESGREAVHQACKGPTNP